MMMVFDKEPGQSVMINNEGAIFIGEPDWIRLPQPLGGHMERVIAVEWQPCACGAEANARHYVLKSANVCECRHGDPAQFLWYRPRREG